MALVHSNAQDSRDPLMTISSQHSDPMAVVAADASSFYELSQHFYFEAAHTLDRTIDAEGSRRIHGHTYDCEVTLRGRPAENGMLIDLAYFRAEIAKVRDQLDHRFLDEVEGLGAATIENLCAFVRVQLQDSVPGLCAVMIERRASGDRCTLHWGAK